jgi:hypothetical protein
MNMDKVKRRNKNEEPILEEDTLVYRYGIRDNVVKGLGIASLLGVIGFAAFKGYNKLKELEEITAELEQNLKKK